MPFVLSHHLWPQGPIPAPLGKPVAPVLGVNTTGTQLTLSSGLRNPELMSKPTSTGSALWPGLHTAQHFGEAHPVLPRKRPFLCSTCGVAFMTPSILHRHRQVQAHLNNSWLS